MKIKITAAFFAIYIIWGSTYLAIRYGIETIQPLTLGMIRFAIAGLVMMLVSVVAKEKKLNRSEVKIGIISGVLMMAANGFVCIVELTVPSGIVAVFIGTAPIWMLVISWLFFNGPTPTFLKLTGAILGMFGIYLIAQDASQTTTQTSPWLGFGLLTISCLTWTFGSLIPRRLPKIKSGFLFTGLQMFAGAIALGVFSFIFEKPYAYDWSQVSSASWWALIYLITFGSLIAFSAYTWLARNVQPHLVSTYALVNPVVAVILGSLFYNEPLGPHLVGATTLVVFGLSLLILPSKKS